MPDIPPVTGGPTTAKKSPSMKFFLLGAGLIVVFAVVLYIVSKNRQGASPSTTANDGASSGSGDSLYTLNIFGNGNPQAQPNDNPGGGTSSPPPNGQPIPGTPPGPMPPIPAPPIQPGPVPIPGGLPPVPIQPAPLPPFPLR